MMISSQKKHLNIISGFLGSGKTTAILRYITEQQLNERILVIINEFGENNIDGHEIELRNWGSKFSIWHIPGGCICCVSKMILNKKLIEAAKSKEFDRIIIEPSGLARASDIIDMVDKSTLKTAFHIHPVICMVHPAMTNDGHSIREPIVWEQIHASDIIVSNFSDKIAPAEVAKFELKMNGFNPKKMDLIFTYNGQLNPDVFNLNYPVYKIHKKFPTLEKSTTGFGTKSFRWGREKVFNLISIIDYFEEVKKITSIVRAKGFFNTDKGWMKIDISNGNFVKTSSDYRADSRIDFHYLDNELSRTIIIKALAPLSNEGLLFINVENRMLN